LTFLLTGYAGEASTLVVSGALNGGAFALVRKPVTGAGLSEQVAMLLSTSGGEPTAQDGPRDNRRHAQDADDASV
jgi:hypothetical protein